MISNIKVKRFFSRSWPFFAMAFLLIIFGAVMLDELAPKPVVPTKYMEINHVPVAYELINKGIFLMMAGIALGWAFYGVGFIIIGRY